MLDQPEKIDATCPFCHGTEVFMTDIKAALNAPLPTLYSIKCNTCSRTGEGWQEGEEWQIKWDEPSPSVGNPRSTR